MRREDRDMDGQRKSRLVFSLGCLVSALALMSSAGLAQKVTSEEPAGYLVFPKIVVDPSGQLTGTPRDTVIRITNTDGNNPRIAHCFYVDGTPRCSIGDGLDGFGACRTNENCATGGICAVRECAVTNFDLTLTPGQPVGWRASEGVTTTGLCNGTAAGLPCSSDSDCPGSGNSCVQLDADDFGRVPPLGPGIFIGELKCVQVDRTTNITEGPGTPVNRNDLIGNASIYAVTAADSTVDVQSYNAIGVQAASDDGTTQGDTSMNLSDSGGEYAGCPAQVVVNHFFDAADLGGGRIVQSDITLVPCSEQLELNTVFSTVLQILVFNEFEQRFSTSTTLGCYRESRLSNLDRRPGQEITSIFNVNVQGTLAGQTVIRPVLSGNGNPGNGILAVVEEFHSSQAGRRSAAFNVHWRGTKNQADTVSY